MRVKIALVTAAMAFSTLANAVVVTPPTVSVSGITGTTGMVQTIAAPDSSVYADAVLFGSFESNTTSFVWKEQTAEVGDLGVSALISGGENITAPGTLQTLSAGTYDSYFLHMESDVATLGGPQGLTYTGSITFDQKIVALIYNKQENCVTHPIFGSLETDYPTPPNCGTNQNFDFARADNWITISADAKTLNFSQYTPHDMDQVRILTAVPIPAAVWLFGSGLIGLVGVARRRKVHA